MTYLLEWKFTQNWLHSQSSMNQSSWVYGFNFFYLSISVSQTAKTLVPATYLCEISSVVDLHWPPSKTGQEDTLWEYPWFSGLKLWDAGISLAAWMTLKILDATSEWLLWITGVNHSLTLVIDWTLGDTDNLDSSKNPLFFWVCSTEDYILRTLISNAVFMTSITRDFHNYWWQGAVMCLLSLMYLPAE